MPSGGRPYGFARGGSIKSKRRSPVPRGQTSSTRSAPRRGVRGTSPNLGRVGTRSRGRVQDNPALQRGVAQVRAGVKNLGDTIGRATSTKPTQRLTGVPQAGSGSVFPSAEQSRKNREALKKALGR